MGRLLLVTGGTRSGKSRYAVERASAWGTCVLYVATCQSQDDEMRERVRRHQAERPDTWTTVEPGPDVLAAIQAQGACADGVLLDCLTLYVSGLLMSGCGEMEVMHQVDKLCLTLRQAPRPAAIVTNEVGWGVVPETPLGRQFRDAAGRANQVAARHAQEVVLLVCGLPVVIKSEPSSHLNPLPGAEGVGEG
jgi:adenosylcobinamide kinase/adenosylcobinamide-phosphate guanylyltransferase